MKNLYLRVILPVAAIIILISALSKCSSTSTKTKGIDSLNNTQIDSVVTALVDSAHTNLLNASKVISEPNWSYTEEVDKMTGEKMNFAQVSSTNTVEFKFPYGGGSTCYLTVRKKRKRTEAYINISKGQFISSASDGAVILIKFDNEKPERYSCSEPSDYSSDYLFINGVNRLLPKLKKAKSVIIEVEFYNEGSRQFDFVTAGLTWNN